MNGVGYVVQCSPRTLSRLPAAGERLSLAIETQMREDSIRLFGFLTDAERDWFRLLQGVQGVGSKVALAILGVLPPDELSTAIGRADKTAVARAPGVGPKLAARIVAELKDKAPMLPVSDGLAEGGAAPASMPPAAQDAAAALINLGYPRPQVAAAVEKALSSLGAEAATSALIKQGLKLLSI